MDSSCIQENRNQNLHLSANKYWSVASVQPRPGGTSDSRSWFLAVLCERTERRQYCAAWNSVSKLCSPGLIRSIRGCVSGVLSHTQHGPCLCSSAVVLGGEGFSVGGCSCALSLLSETREDWPSWSINRLHRHTVSSHTATGDILQAYPINQLFLK